MLKDYHTSMTDYAVVLAARMGSERLPGKPLAIYCPDGTTNLEQICRRWLASDRAPRLIIATPDSAENDPIAAIGDKLGLPVSRRDAELPRNVVNEIDLAIATYAPEAKWVARALADNPLVDVGLADWRLDVLAETGADGLWYGQDHERITYAGTTDVWSRAAWDRIARESSGCQLEHPGAYYWDHLTKFNVVQLPLPRREYLQSIRTELDTSQDLEMFRELWDTWARFGDPDNTLKAMQFLGRHPITSGINVAVPTKSQSRAAWPNHFKPRICDHCSQRYGSIVDGNLRLFCPGCGAPLTYYAHKPLTHSHQMR